MRALGDGRVPVIPRHLLTRALTTQLWEETLLKKQCWWAVPEGGSEVRLQGLAEAHEPGCGLTGVSWKDGHLIQHGPRARATGLQAWGCDG